jgi:hypothetical protein
VIWTSGSNFDEPAEHTGDGCAFRLDVCNNFFINILYFRCEMRSLFHRSLRESAVNKNHTESVAGIARNMLSNFSCKVNCQMVK